MQRPTEIPDNHTDGHVIHWAWFYDGLVKVISMGREQEMRRQTIALAELRSGHRVLDVGCGTGSLVIAAARAEPGIEIHGIDPAPEMIKRARYKALAAGVKAAFEVGVIEHLNFDVDTFDVVLSSLMLHHLPEQTRRAGLTEAHRVLKPGGRLVAVDLRGSGPLLHRIGSMFSRGRSRRESAAIPLADLVQTVGFDQAVHGSMRPGFLFSLVARKPT